MQNTLALLFLAAFVEGTTEYLFGDVAALKQYLRYIALVLGVAAALAYNLDMLAALGFNAMVPYVGPVITGVAIGRGSNYINDLVSRLRGDFKGADNG